jgi:hypothetical protein
MAQAPRYGRNICCQETGMTLHEIFLAQAEHREWERAFNVRAARGEFVRHELAASQRRVPIADWVRDLAWSFEVSCHATGFRA